MSIKIAFGWKNQELCVLDNLGTVSLRSFSNQRFLSPPLDIGYQCHMRFYFWIRNIKIRTAILFIPDEVLTPQFK